MREILERLIQGEKLSRNEAQVLLHSIVTQDTLPVQLGALLALFRTRPLTVDELHGFRDALFELRVPLDLGTRDVIDVCGTGGDLKGSFNISTTTAFVVAGAGKKVAKHGNYSLSSLCGSSNVLEHLGVALTADANVLKRCLDEAGICFIHAPLFQPALKRVAPVRRELGIRTFFNILGPLLNPVSPKFQLIGTATRETLLLYGYYLERTDISFAVAHSPDGYDEVSLTGPFYIRTREEERVYDPQELGLARVDSAELKAGLTLDDHANMLVSVLKCEASKGRQDIVTTNAAFALKIADPRLTISDALAQARDSLASGKAWASLEKVRDITRS